MGNQLTDRQSAILEYIKRQLKNKGYPPSVREIGEAVGLRSSSTVHAYLRQLEEIGAIRRDPTKPRAIEIVPENGGFTQKEMVNVPVLGRITAGQPILAVENVEDTFPLPYDFVRTDDVYILSVRGDSMIDAGILDEDLVIVRRQSNANNGDIVAAMIEDEATVKRFFKEHGHIRLQPENPYLEPIIVDEVTILGKVIGVIRRIH